MTKKKRRDTPSNDSKLKMHSPDLTQANIDRLAELFPNCVTETRDDDGNPKQAIDFDQLRQELSDRVVDGLRERYQLNWPGKRAALLAANAPIAKTLRPVSVESSEYGTTKNLFIEGDNLDVLKLIQETYLNKIKLIYADPPYNTGNDLIYDDDFSADSESYFLRSNQVNEVGHRLTSNSDSDGRFHSNWLSMMYPRLRIASRLLTQDGAIFVSCDEIEQPRLRLIMDEIFGQRNFVADMVWAAGRKNDSRHISVSHEYIVCYAKDVQYLKEQKIIWRQRKKGLDDIYAEYRRLKKIHGTDYASMSSRMKEWFKNLGDSHPAKAHKHYSFVDSRGVYFAADISWPGGGGPKYEVVHPKTNRSVKIPSRGWITPDPRKMLKWIADGRVHFGDDETSVPCLKKYLSDSELQTPYSVFYQDGRGASKRLRKLMGSDVFDFPKDEFVLKEIVEMLTTGEDIVLDYFAGSATMANAVIDQNATDGNNRRFIMVQLPEAVNENSKAFNAGYKTIAEIGKERIRRAGARILESNCHPGWNRDVGFRVLKVDTSNMKDVYYTPDAATQEDLLGQIDNTKEDRTDEDLLFQVLLDWGVDLTLPIMQETIVGKRVFFVDENALAACFESGIDEDFVKKLAEHKPLRAVFRDSGYGSDNTKINVEQIFKLISPATEVKTI